jgi:hypothetical protein
MDNETTPVDEPAPDKIVRSWGLKLHLHVAGDEPVALPTNDELSAEIQRLLTDFAGFTGGGMRWTVGDVDIVG